MNPVSQRAAFAAHFRAIGNEERATNEKRYLKSDLEFYGVPVPVLRQTAKQFQRAHANLPRDELLALVRALWDDPHHELRMLGIALLERYRDRLTAADMTFTETLLRRSNTWAQADWLATKIAGSLVARFPGARRALPTWARDENLWVRRSSLLALNPRRRPDDFELFARLAITMLDEREFFIRKAIGWVLRETSKSHPDLVHGFLTGHIDEVSGLTLRQGSKYLPSTQREALARSHKNRSQE